MVPLDVVRGAPFTTRAYCPARPPDTAYYDDRPPPSPAPPPAAAAAEGSGQPLFGEGHRAGGDSSRPAQPLFEVHTSPWLKPFSGDFYIGPGSAAPPPTGGGGSSEGRAQARVVLLGEEGFWPPGC